MSSFERRDFLKTSAAGAVMLPALTAARAADRPNERIIVAVMGLEGRRKVEAARKYDRVVQTGTQRRSSPQLASARDFVRAGKLGKVPFVQTWIAGHRKSIGHKQDAPVPTGVDYSLWLGPAPERPF